MVCNVFCGGHHDPDSQHLFVPASCRADSVRVRGCRRPCIASGRNQKSKTSRATPFRAGADRTPAGAGRAGDCATHRSADLRGTGPAVACAGYRLRSGRMLGRRQSLQRRCRRHLSRSQRQDVPKQRDMDAVLLSFRRDRHHARARTGAPVRAGRRCAVSARPPACRSHVPMSPAHRFPAACPLPHPAASTS